MTQRADKLEHRKPNYRAEAILIRRCREGDVEALEVLAYRLAPALWAGAKAADVPDPAGRCIEGWRAALQALRAWHAPSVARLQRVALSRAGLRAAGHDDAVPAEVYSAIAAASASASPALAEATRRRRFWLLQGYAVIAALVLGAVMMLATYQSMDRFSTVSRTQLASLQFRIRHAALSARLRDISWDLPGQVRGRSAVAEVLESAALALDEIASTPTLRADRLRYVVWRVAAADLPGALRDLAQWLPPTSRPAVLDAALALEEVEVWFGAG